MLDSTQKGKLCLPYGLPSPPHPRLALLARREAALLLAHIVDPRRRPLAVAHMNTNCCTRCHRMLKDPVSVELGMGPVCRAKASGVSHVQRVPDLLGRRAHYDVVKVTPEIVWIRDRVEDGVISVTNDAENVIKELHNKHPGARIIYRDSDGAWDELKHDGCGTFTGFAPARDMVPA